MGSWWLSLPLLLLYGWLHVLPSNLRMFRWLGLVLVSARRTRECRHWPTTTTRECSTSHSMCNSPRESWATRTRFADCCMMSRVFELIALYNNSVVGYSEWSWLDLVDVSFLDFRLSRSHSLQGTLATILKQSEAPKVYNGLQGYWDWEREREKRERWSMWWELDVPFWYSKLYHVNYIYLTSQSYHCCSHCFIEICLWLIFIWGFALCRTYLIRSIVCSGSGF